MPPEIEFFNRYSGRVETEQVYGAAYMRLIYGNPLGQVALHGLVKRAAFSRWYGRRMESPSSRKKILPFISEYKLNAAEFAQPPTTFKTFNEFFYRQLKPGARPIDSDPAAAVFPADGRHLGFQDISKMEGIFIKGAVFKLEQLFQNAALSDRYRDGTMIMSRLCPVDYHRFHFAVGGVPTAPALIGGHLLSVNPVALRQNIHILTENKRYLSQIHSPEFGQVAMFEVGATNVGTVEYTFVPGVTVQKGSEKGFFKFGGSLTITIFEKGKVRLENDLIENSKIGRELYARMGDRMGKRIV